MNTENIYDMELTRQEIDELCRMYLDGELGIEDEKDLAKVLSLSDCQSELVQDCLMLMGMSKVVAAVDKEKKSGVPAAYEPLRLNRQPFIKIFKSCVAAACIIIAVTFVWNAVAAGGADTEPVYAVYEDGVLLNPEESKEIALQSYRRSMEMLAEMRKIERQQLSETRRIILETERDLNMIN